MLFRNLRFSAASLAVGFVFFALMGVVYFLTTYLQSVMGYTALEAGVRMLPVAVGMVSATKLSVVLTEKRGTKIVVATGMSTVASALYLISTCGVDTGYGRVALALGMLGTGMSLAMSPATVSALTHNGPPLSAMPAVMGVSTKPGLISTTRNGLATLACCRP